MKRFGRPVIFRCALSRYSLPPESSQAHWHEYVEILYIKDGVLSAIVQAVEYELHTGDLMIINSGDLHMTRTPGCHYLILQISARQLRSYLPDFDQLRFDTLISYTKSKQNAQLFSALHAMETIFQEQPHHYELLFTARLYEFLYILCLDHCTTTASTVTADSDRDRLRITRVMQWIREHYQENLTLDTAASLLAVSREYFCRLFKKYTGQTFLEYLNDVRTIHLAKDLSACDDTITSLMEKHGLTNYKVFLRTFQKTLRNFSTEIPQGNVLSMSEITVSFTWPQESKSLLPNIIRKRKRQLINIASPKLKNLYRSCTATSYACMIFSFPASADTSISNVDSGRWKFVIRASIHLNLYPG